MRWIFHAAVAGLAALYIGAKGNSNPAAVRAALEAAAKPLEGAPVEQQGKGLTDAAALLK